jgi:hypothetical protein
MTFILYDFQVEELRKLARQWRQGGMGDLTTLNDVVAKFTVDEMNDVSPVPFSAPSVHASRVNACRPGGVLPPACTAHI